MTGTLTPEWAQVISEAMSDALLDVHTALPGRVQKFNSSDRTADIEIQSNRSVVDEDYETVSETIGVLKDVRVGTTGSGGYIQTTPIEEGTTGLLIFSEVHIGQWKATGRVCDPDDVGRHSLSSPIFVPMYLTDSDTEISDNLQDGAVVGKIGGTQLRANSGAVEVVSNGADSADSVVALSETIDAYFTILDSMLLILDSTVLAGAYAAAKSAAGLPATGLPPTGAANLKADKIGVP